MRPFAVKPAFSLIWRRFLEKENSEFLSNFPAGDVYSVLSFKRQKEAAVEEESKRKDPDPIVEVQIDDRGRQYVDLKNLVSKPSVRKTLEDLQSRFPGNGREPKVRTSGRGR